ncbi:MAG: hypothetical protein Q2306_01120 [Phytoplasma sp.]|uniref:hypothetical protein n=1 Tax=Phytoplasma sp. TaxID=2155 RepID=UPI002B407589|nr:hypothetical protein [Phytoplasma sp.]WRH06927.1 MAG: hypothetical protein Q2306_01120 [Phytoplasma sp.]
MINKNELLEKFKVIIQNKKLTHLYLIESSNIEEQKLFMFELVYEFLKNSNCSESLKKLIRTFSYPNFYYLDSYDKKITKEQILAMQSYFNQTSLIQEKKVYVINGIENISYNSSNSLLYFLENPINENILGILLTKDRHLLLPTILSRAQIFSLANKHYTDLSLVNEVEQLNELDIILISLLKKNRTIEIDDYFYDLKKFFVFFLNTLPEKEIVSKLFFHVRFLIKDKYFMDDFILLVINFFLDLYYKKNDFVSFFPSFLSNNTFYNKLPFSVIIEIWNCLLDVEQKKIFLDSRSCCVLLFIELDKKIKSFIGVFGSK